MSEKFQILTVLPLEERHREYLIKQVSGSGEEAEFTWSTPSEVTPEMAAGADVVIGNVSPSVLKEAYKNPSCRLKWVQLNSAGSDAYLQEGVLSPETILTCSSGAYETSVSEHMLALTFALVRRFDQYARQQSRREWKSAGKITSIRHSTVLVLGLGDIGRRYGEMMHALGARVIGIRRTEHEEKPDWLEVQDVAEHLDSWLPEADIVAMVLPGGEATRHIMDERRLRLMKKGAYLVNCGRGNAIDPGALKKVLSEGHLGGAALDVTEPEPLPTEDPLWAMDRVIITPHVAGQFLLAETLENVVEIAAENLHSYVYGKPLIHVVDRTRGY